MNFRETLPQTLRMRLCPWTQSVVLSMLFSLLCLGYLLFTSKWRTYLITNQLLSVVKIFLGAPPPSPQKRTCHLLHSL